MNIWYGLLVGRVVGTPFLKENTIKKNTYLTMLEMFAFPQWRHRKGKVNCNCFPTGGGPTPFSLKVRRTLNSLFPEKWTSKGRPIIWPQRSADLTQLDFWVWKHVRTWFSTFSGEILRFIDLPAMFHRTWGEILYCLDVYMATKVLTLRLPNITTAPCSVHISPVFEFW